MLPPFIVRYVSADSKVFIDLANGPLLDLEDFATARIRRLAESYHFSTWESSHGDLWTVDFTLRPSFYTLTETPKSLRDDLKWLSLECGQPDLATIDIFWIVQQSRKLFKLDNGSKTEDSRD